MCCYVLGRGWGEIGDFSDKSFFINVRMCYKLGDSLEYIRFGIISSFFF